MAEKLNSASGRSLAMLYNDMFTFQNKVLNILINSIDNPSSVTFTARSIL